MTFLFGVPVGVVEHGTLRKVEREESFKRNALAGVESENVEVGEGLFPGINSPAMCKFEPLKLELRLRRLDKGVTGPLADCPVELAKGDEARCNGDESDMTVHVLIARWMRVSIGY